MKGKTNFDQYLEDQLKDLDFAARFEQAGKAWDIAIKIAVLRKEAGLSQKELAQMVGTSQQQISRLESPSYEGHSLSMLRRVAEVLGANVHVEIERKRHTKHAAVAESKSRRLSENSNQPTRNKSINNSKNIQILSQETNSFIDNYLIL